MIAAMRSAALLALGLVACTTPDAGPGGDDDPTVPDAAITGGDDPDAAVLPAPDATPDPGDGVEWFTWPAQQNIGEVAWGAALTDIARHLPASYGDTYWFEDSRSTSGHEVSHGIHAHLRNYEAPNPFDYNALYVLHDKAAFILEPDIRKADVVPFVPTSLRGPRFQLYLIEQTAWDDSPLYVFDEWNAYVNGAEVGVGLATAGMWTEGWTDVVMGPLEFVVYAIATVQAARDGDPTYDFTQLEAFTAWNIRRAMALFETGRALAEFEWDDQDAYATRLRTGTATGVEALRAFARETWGAGWTMEVLGF